jgi:non-specific serine/threonine protein kinase/serine/threonine-protein kinase
MTPDGWGDVDRLVGDALELPEVDRRAFVLAACDGRPNLASTVLALLAEDGRQGPLDILDAAEPSALDAGLAGVRLGPYRLIREIGRGGMGSVWLADRDDRQFQKRVAVKILSPSLPASEALRRFREERQILASLEHPNIARLLDAGCSDGLHYFVMEFVEGAPIADHCNSRKLDIRTRATLLRTIASTVHFAHQRLVVHRDLKPANILVTADGEPRLLDFGIAKMLAPDSTTATVPLLHLATPAYASPEQLNGSPATTASDVYSLGILSCELLGGGLPDRTAGSVERPSAVALRMASGKMTGRQLADCLTGDLDAIIVKATQPLPQDRYASAEDLAEDLGSYLAGRPVAARGGALRYRLGKFAVRHRAAVAAATIALLAATAGVAAIIWQSRVASRERQVAEARFNDVRQLASAMMTDVYNQIAPLPGSTEARHSLVTHALLYLNRLAGEKNVDRTLALELVNGYLRIGQVQFNSNIGNLGDTTGALESYGTARRILDEQLKQTPTDVESQRLLARTYGFTAEVQQYLRKPAEARTSVEALVHIRESLAARGSPEDRRGLAGAYFQLGNLLDSDDRDDRSAAVDAKKKSLTLFEALLSETPADHDAQRNVALASKSIGATLQDLHQFEEAEAHYRRALALDEARVEAEPGSAMARMDLSFDLSSLGTLLVNRKSPEALGYFERTIAIRRSLVEADPKDARARARLAYALLRSGRARMQLGDHARAVDDFTAAVVLADHLLSINPNDGMARSYAAEGLHNLSTSEEALTRVANEPERTGHARRACDAIRQAVDHYHVNIQMGTSSASDRKDVADAERRLGACRS